MTFLQQIRDRIKSQRFEQVFDTERGSKYARGVRNGQWMRRKPDGTFLGPACILVLLLLSRIGLCTRLKVESINKVAKELLNRFLQGMFRGLSLALLLAIILSVCTGVHGTISLALMEKGLRSGKQHP